jgi:uncharacterized membrane protein YcaP (DUF421 family)
MVGAWLGTSFEAAGLVFISAVGIYLAVILLTRLHGLRSFSRMSAFDFAMTVAIGTLISGTAANREPPLLQALVAVVVLFVLQFAAARLRLQSPRAKNLLDNRPLLLMRDGKILHENLESARITESDIWGQLRAANVLDVRNVRAVVLETTGDVSVLHSPEGGPLDERILTGVEATRA